MTGKAYRMTLKGKLLWKAGPYRASMSSGQVGGVPGTWTDGGAALGPNNLMRLGHAKLGLCLGLGPGIR